MRVTAALLFYIRRKHIGGKITIGKHRAPTPVRDWMRNKAVQDLITQQNNMDLLSNPCLSYEEDRAFIENEELREQKRAAELEERREKRWLKHRYIENELNYLNITKAWE